MQKEVGLFLQFKCETEFNLKSKNSIVLDVISQYKTKDKVKYIKILVT